MAPEIESVIIFKSRYNSISFYQRKPTGMEAGRHLIADVSVAAVSINHLRVFGVGAGEGLFAKRCPRPQPKQGARIFLQRISRGAEKAIPRNARFLAPPVKTLVLLAVYQGRVYIMRR